MVNIKKIFKGSFLRNILMLAGGTAIAQALAVLAIPIITRIFSPEEYGILTVYTALLVLFTGSQSLRYELGIPIAEDEKKAINVLGLSFIILLVFSILTFIIVMLSNEQVFIKFSAQGLYQYKILIPLGFFLLGLYQLFMMWNIRIKDFKSIAKTKISRSVGSNILTIILGLLGWGPLGLLLGKVFGESVGIVTLSKPVLRKDKRRLLKYINSKEVFESAKKLRKFPTYSLPSAFLSKAGDQIPVFFIAALFGAQIVGYYGLAKSIITIPTALIGSSIGDVFYGEAAAIGKKSPSDLKKLSIKMFSKLLLIGLLPTIMFVVFSPVIFKTVFGNEWFEAGIYARILAIWALAQIIFQPISRVYDIYGKQKELLIITLVRVILICVVFGFAHIFELSSYFAVMGYAFIMFLIYGVTYLLSLKIIENQIIKEAKK